MKCGCLPSLVSTSQTSVTSIIEQCLGCVNESNVLVEEWRKWPRLHIFVLWGREAEVYWHLRSRHLWRRTLPSSKSRRLDRGQWLLLACMKGGQYIQHRPRKPLSLAIEMLNRWKREVKDETTRTPVWLKDSDNGLSMQVTTAQQQNCYRITNINKSFLIIRRYPRKVCLLLCPTTPTCSSLILLWTLDLGNVSSA